MRSGRGGETWWRREKGGCWVSDEGTPKRVRPAQGVATAQTLTHRLFTYSIPISMTSYRYRRITVTNALSGRRKKSGGSSDE